LIGKETIEHRAMNIERRRNVFRDFINGLSEANPSFDIRYSIFCGSAVLRFAVDTLKLGLGPAFPFLRFSVLTPETRHLKPNLAMHTEVIDMTDGAIEHNTPSSGHLDRSYDRPGMAVPISGSDELARCTILCPVTINDRER